MLEDYFRISWQGIRNRKLRSYLTMVGIVIGIVALISLITLGQAMENGVKEQFDKFGTRRIFIGPKTVSGAQVSFGGPPTGTGTLTQDDVRTLESIPEAEYVIPLIMERVSVKHGNEEEYLASRGIETRNFREAFLSKARSSMAMRSSNEVVRDSPRLMISKEGFTCRAALIPITTSST